MDAALQPSAADQHATVAQPAVVKLGGSVVRGGTLKGWLDVIADAKRPVVLVPGGGALADEVRDCQRQLGFGDVTAHRMALLAMDQLAWAIAGMRPGYEVGIAVEDLRGILQRGLVAVWAPSSLVADHSDIEATWRLTSDSLALWLANKLGAETCCVVKSAALPHGQQSANALMQDGIVDEAFPAMLAETGIPTTIFGQGDHAALAAQLAGKVSAPSPVVV